MAGEFYFIEWLRSQQPPSEAVPVPPGDDLAVLRWRGGADDLLLVGADQVIDGVHFDAALHPPRAIGRKAMNRNLSDCAAMACLPAAAVATVALPTGVGVEYAKELYLGLREAADPFDCPIVGGDTATWTGRLVLSVTILGRSAGVKPVTRAGARPGDGVYVTGPLGGSIRGRHMTFTPLVTHARKLAQNAPIHAMLDLSDGLSRDLRHICAASGGLGAVIVAAQVPIHDDTLAMPRDNGMTPLDHALHDGEDYELLFTAPPGRHLGATRVGTITEEPGLWLQTYSGRTPLEPGGWEHAMR